MKLSANQRYDIYMALSIFLFDFVSKQFNENHMRDIINKIEDIFNTETYQVTKQPEFTQEQKDWICYQIGDWYLTMKPLLEGQHNLGYMKERLKTMVCDGLQI